MRLVQQLTPFTCGLACVESASFDLGKPITQAELLVRYKDVLIGSSQKIEQFGAATGETIDYLLNDLGFTTFIHKDHRLDVVRDTLNRLSERQAALISGHFNQSTWHFVRWAGFQDEQTLLAMNPSFSLPRATIMPYAFTDLVNWDFTLLLVTAE
jgi:hypothetical protein